jgi:hypothetical protein
VTIRCDSAIEVDLVIVEPVVVLLAVAEEQVNEVVADLSRMFILVNETVSPPELATEGTRRATRTRSFSVSFSRWAPGGRVAHEVQQRFGRDESGVAGLPEAGAALQFFRADSRKGLNLGFDLATPEIRRSVEPDLTKGA